MKLSLSDFDYVLPPNLIAVWPAKDRTSAKLLRVDPKTGNLSHHVFWDLGQFLKQGDVLVLNDTQVLPARIFGRKESGGKVEALLLEEKGGNRWEALLRPGGRIREGCRISFGENGVRIQAVVLDGGRLNSGGRILQFEGDSVKEGIRKIGHIPLPPYIDRPDSEIDREFYQTVFARKEGAVASPTAGLHFDRALLEELSQKGIEIVAVTLHVSTGTFQPVTEEDLSRHQMFEESFEVTEEAAHQINRALEEGRRIIACGTTSVRALESAVDPRPSLSLRERVRVRACAGKTDLFIYPPYQFKVVKGLITNFHLPKTSLLFLVAAFLGRDKLFEVYAEAIRERYRFYSYGDAMVIL